MTRYLIILCTLFVLGYTIGPLILVKILPSHTGDWAIDPASGCKVWDESPTSSTIVSWSGRCPNGVAEGKGKLIFEYHNGGEPFWDVYEGDLENGIAEGFGQLHYSNGTTYVGEFSGGEFNGQGMFTEHFEDGVVVMTEGEFKDGTLHGEGKLERYEPDGIRTLRVAGSFEVGEPIEDSLVELFTNNGWTFRMRGPVSMNPFKFIGDIHARSEDGAEWKFNGRLTSVGFSGVGKLKRPNGMEYEGEISDLKLNGQGWAKWPSGSSYNGYWKDNLRHGEGVYINKIGHKCSGMWLDDALVGIGDAVLNDGKKMKCIWDGSQLEFFE